MQIGCYSVSRGAGTHAPGRSPLIKSASRARIARPCSSNVRPVARPSHTVVQAAGNDVPVTFRVKKEVGAGEHVRVVGSPKVLGEWDIKKALELRPSEGKLWSGTADVTLARPFQFKFAVVSDAEKAAVFESTGDRTFQPGGAQTITAVFNKPGFEAGAAAPGSGGQAGGWQGAPQGGSINQQVKARLEATLRRLAEEALAAS